MARDRLQPELLQLRVQELDVERGVVDDELRAAHVLEKLGGDLGEARLVLEELVGDAVDAQRALLHCPLGVDVAVEMVPGEAPGDQLDAADLDDPVPEPRVETGRFGVEDDLSHSD